MGRSVLQGQLLAAAALLNSPPLHPHPPLLQGYQFNHLVQRTDEAYPALWVAPGSANSQLGRALGMDADFVTGEVVWHVGSQARQSGGVRWRRCGHAASPERPRPPSPPGPAVPLGYVLLSWEPTDTAALVLRAVTMAKEALYWALIVAFPVAGWTVLFPVLIILKYSRCHPVGGVEGGEGALPFALAQVPRHTPTRPALPCLQGRQDAPRRSGSHPEEHRRQPAAGAPRDGHGRRSDPGGWVGGP